MAPFRATLSTDFLLYTAPVIVTVIFISAKTVAACFLHEPTKGARQKWRRYAVAACLAVVLGSLLVQAICALIDSQETTSDHTDQASAVNICASFFVYISFFLGTIENSTPLWYPYGGAFWVALTSEVAIIITHELNRSSSHASAMTEFVSRVVRVAALLVAACLASIFVLQDRASLKQSGEEAQPLLADDANKSSQGQEYGAIQSNETSAKDDDDDDCDVFLGDDPDETDRDKEIKAQQRKRLQEAGSWLNYLKNFRVFIPILWPSRDRTVQACIVFVFVIILADRVFNVLVPRQFGILISELTRSAGTGIVPWQALRTWLLLVYLSSGIGISVLRSFCDLKIQQFTYKSIGSTSFRHIMNLSMDFHNEKSSGELIRAVEQGHNLHGMLDFILFEVGPMFLDLGIAFFYVAHLFDIYMSLILLAVGVSYVWVGAKTTKWGLKQRRQFNNAMRDESRVQNEALSNWQTVSHFNRNAYECARYDGTLDAFNAAEWQFYIAYYFGGSFQSAIMLFGRLAAAVLAVYRVVQGRADVGAFVTLLSYWGTIESPLRLVSYSVRRVSQMLTDSERLLQLFMTTPTVADVPGAKELVVKAGEVEFSNVGFAYDPRKPILKDVSFHAKGGQTIALVGETGGGKSTVLKLLYRYYDVNAGSICIDGQDIRNVTLDSLRDSFGMVPQDPALFNVTLMENLKYARLDATDEEVMDACRAAAIHDKILTFPDGYKSKVGERGVKLSGGELQRVAIARAILRQPKIVLLDEATSMIDAETEASIQQALRHLTAGRTTFVIAHRLSTIQHADLILVIHGGEIIERGTHEELFKLKGKYVALWSKQLSKEVQNAAADLKKAANDSVADNEGAKASP